MRLLRFVLGAPWYIVLLSSGAGLLSGLLSIGLIALINTVLHSPAHMRAALLWAFVAAVVAKVATHALARVSLARYTQDAIARLRRELGGQILAASLDEQERIGAPKLLAALTDDVQAVTVALRDIPGLMVNLAVVIGAAVYFAWLSWAVFLVLAVVGTVGLIGYGPLIARATALLRDVRVKTDELHGHFRAIIEGMRELKLHRQRRDAFTHASLEPTTEDLKRLRVAASERFIAGQSWTQLLLYGLLGALLFADFDAVTPAALTGYLFTLVYLIGPVAALSATIPNLIPANVSLERIAALGLVLGESAESDGSPVLAPGAWQRLALDSVTYRYPHAPGDRDFQLGPLDFAVHPGELVFVAGGNGSGKSTFAKLLCGLYVPCEGSVTLRGTPIVDDNREWYRSHFSAVFPNPFVFDTLLGLDRHDRDERAQGYLTELGLEGNVRIEDGVLSTTRLSDGQRKRLALLTAYLEDRPIYVFDEWAADQDPEFKAAFYNRLLPELKDRGKAILVISHDERYFGVADRVLSLDDGQLTEVPGATVSEPS